MLDLTLPTALILIDNQAAFNHPTHWGTARSNPHYEANVTSLVTAFRAARKSSSALVPLEIIHIFHSSPHITSPLHPQNPEKGVCPLSNAEPAADGSETVMWKTVNSCFVGTKLEDYLREKGVRQVVFAGLTTDHCVSTSVRMAANLGVVDRGEDKGKVIVVGDATATWAKGGFDAEVVHAVNLASLQTEFAEVLMTEEVVNALRWLST